MGARHDGRVIAFQTLYRYELNRAPLGELLDFSWLVDQRPRPLGDDVRAFASLLIAGCVENLDQIDHTIDENLEHWDMSRLSRVDLSALRLGVYCLLHQPDIPAEVTIDEVVSIAKQFGAEQSYRFVNGVLDGIRKQLAAAR